MDFHNSTYSGGILISLVLGVPIYNCFRHCFEVKYLNASKIHLKCFIQTRLWDSLLSLSLSLSLSNMGPPLI
jgi:hypothetical protein